MVKRIKAFTLAELLIVIAIVVVLIGVAIPIVSSALKKAHTAKCYYQMRALKSSYMVEASDNDFHVNDPLPVLSAAMVQYKGSIIDAHTYKAECGGTCTIKYAEDYSCILNVSCSLHGGSDIDDQYVAGSSYGLEKAKKGIIAILNHTDIRTIIENYMEARITEKNVSLDSTGKNFGTPMNAILKSLGYDTESEYSWRIYLNNQNGNHSYVVYWTNDNLSNIGDGERTEYLRYEYDYKTDQMVGQPVTGMVGRTVKSSGAQTLYVINYEGDITTDTEFGSSWNVEAGG